MSEVLYMNQEPAVVATSAAPPAGNHPPALQIACSAALAPAALAPAAAGALTFLVTAADRDEWWSLSPDCQADVTARARAMHGIDTAATAWQGALQAARRGVTGWSAKSLDTLHRRWVTSGRDWRSLINTSRWPRRKAGTAVPREFIDHIVTQILTHQRLHTDLTVFKKLRAQWRRWLHGDVRSRLPGYDVCPPDSGAGHPAGWSFTNLRALVRPQLDRATRALAKIGTAAATKILPTVPGTRRGARPFEWIFFDDVWHDRKVYIPGLHEPVRMLQLGCLDFATGVYLKFGLRPAVRGEDKAQIRIRHGDMKALVAVLLEEYGYPRGFVMNLVFERGTAYLSPAEAQVLYEISGGHIVCHWSSMEGGFVASYDERRSGNSRAKSPLESWHSFMHNWNSDLPGQVGKDRDHSPAALLGSDRESAGLVRAGYALPPEQRADLVMPYEDFETGYLTSLDRVAQINARLDHKLEGFGRIIELRYPGCAGFTAVTPQVIAQLPADWQKRFESRARDESPIERLRRLHDPATFAPFDRGALRLFYAFDHVLVTVAPGPQITFEKDSRQFIYRPAGGMDESVTEGTKLIGYARPWDRGTLHLHRLGKDGGAGAYVATWPLVERVRRGDQAALAARLKENRSTLNRSIAAVQRGLGPTIDRLERAAQHNIEILATAPMLGTDRGADSDPEAGSESTSPAVREIARHEASQKRATADALQAARAAAEIDALLHGSAGHPDPCASDPPPEWAL